MSNPLTPSPSVSVLYFRCMLLSLKLGLAKGTGVGRDERRDTRRHLWLSPYTLRPVLCHRVPLVPSHSHPPLSSSAKGFSLFQALGETKGGGPTRIPSGERRNPDCKGGETRHCYHVLSQVFLSRDFRGWCVYSPLFPYSDGVTHPFTWSSLCTFLAGWCIHSRGTSVYPYSRFRPT